MDDMGGMRFQGTSFDKFFFLQKRMGCQLQPASDVGLFGGTLLDTWNAECYAD